MGEFTGGALFLLLTFVTPALPLFLAARLMLPKKRLPAGTDLSVILVACLFSLFLNASMFLYLGTQLSLLLRDVAPQPLRTLLEVLFSFQAPICPHRPVLWFLDRFKGITANPSNIVLFILDLHFRMAIVAAGAWVAYTCIARLEEWLAALRYSRSPIQQKIAKLLGAEMMEGESRYIIESGKDLPSRIDWLFAPVRLLREIFYHPWATLTKYYPAREFLIADVYTKEGSLYSGILTNWVPDKSKEDLNAICLQYILRYRAKEGPPPNVNYSPFTVYKRSDARKKELIKNNGELILPAAEIQTIHIWEVRKRAVPEVLIKAEEDFPVLQWLLTLALVNPNHFDEIRVTLKHRELFESLRSELKKWVGPTKAESLALMNVTFIVPLK